MQTKMYSCRQKLSHSCHRCAQPPSELLNTVTSAPVQSPDRFLPHQPLPSYSAQLSFGHDISWSQSVWIPTCPATIADYPEICRTSDMHKRMSAPCRYCMNSTGRGRYWHFTAQSKPYHACKPYANARPCYGHSCRLSADGRSTGRCCLTCVRTRGSTSF